MDVSGIGARGRRRRLIDAERRCEPGGDLTKDFGGNQAGELGSANGPIRTLQVVGEYDAANRQAGWEGYLEGISLGLACDRTDEGEAGASVVRRWGKHQSGTAAGLFTAGLGTEGEPDEMPAIWDVCASHQISLPTGSPQSVSRWRFSGVIAAANCSRLYLCWMGFTTSRPPATVSSTKAPSASRASRAKAEGMRKARLFPHLPSFVSKTEVPESIYTEHTPVVYPASLAGASLALRLPAGS